MIEEGESGRVLVYLFKFVWWDKRLYVWMLTGEIWDGIKNNSEARQQQHLLEGRGGGLTRAIANDISQERRQLIRVARQVAASPSTGVG
jgi:hypothetical protein